MKFICGVCMIHNNRVKKAILKHRTFYLLLVIGLVIFGRLHNINRTKTVLTQRLSQENQSRHSVGS